jgi:hypothetical protein
MKKVLPGSFSFLLIHIALSLFLLVSGCERESKQNELTDYISVYDELISDIGGYDLSFADKHSRMPLFRNFIVSDLQANPARLPAFSSSILDEISNTRSTVVVLHLLHRLSSVSAGGYGPPVSGAGRWKRDRGSSIRIPEDFRRFAAETEEGGIGLVITEKAEKELISLGEESVQLVSDLLDLVSLLIRVTPCFADIDAFNELRSSDPWFRRLETPELLTVPFRESEIYSNLHRRFFDSVDPLIIAFGSRVMIEEMNLLAERYKALVEKEEFGTESPLVLETRFGRVQFLTGSSDTIRQPFLISLDPGGDDYYCCNAAVSEAVIRPVSIVVDLKGNDSYGVGEELTTICSSSWGLSYILDMEGDDEYFSRGMGLAFSIAGCSVLDDRSGDDKYICSGEYSLAAAFFGHSLLIDHTGNDEYRSGSYSMGFGGSKGVALHLDYHGNDRYLTPTSFFTMGTSKGRWADATDGFSIAGGVGILMDFRGDDEYSSEGFSLGASYYYGLGLFADIDGADRYNSVSHSMGAAVHSSLALFADQSGNDKYNSDADSLKLTQSIGYGRDWSAAFFFERSGDDEYCFGNKSFGVGDIHSLGFALEIAGNDRYYWFNNDVYNEYESFGSAQILEGGMNIDPGKLNRPAGPCAGAAYDLKGKDIYKVFPINAGSFDFFRNRKVLRRESATLYSIRQDKTQG